MNKLKQGQQGHLIDLKVGQKAIVLGMHNKPGIKRRLMDMGITTGVEVVVKKVAPLGDPVDIYLRGYELCIRKDDLKEIDI